MPRQDKSSRSYSKQTATGSYFYYCCNAGGYNNSHLCSARTHHKALPLEARIWDVVSGLLKDPERLRVGLEHMIEQEARGAHGDPAIETERWLAQLSEIDQKRARYQEMSAEGLIEFEELRSRLVALADSRQTAERELQALRHRTERLETLRRNRDNLMESYASLAPEAIDALGSEERHQVYKMMGVKAHLQADGSMELVGDVVSFSRLEISFA